MEIEKHLPIIRNLLVSHVSSSSKTKNIWQDNKRLKPVIAKAYTFLPGMVRLVVREETFVKFCLDNKHHFVSDSTPKKTTKTKVAITKTKVKKTEVKKTVPKKTAVKKTTTAKSKTIKRK